MNKVLLSFSLCVLLVLTVTLVDSKRSGGRKSGGSSSSGSLWGRNKSNQNKKQDSQHSSSRNHTGGGSHGGGTQHFLDSERKDSSNRGHIGFEKFNNPSQSNPGGIGFGGVNPGSHRPSAPPVGGNQGLGSAFGGASYPQKTQNTHVQSAPYPANNNPAGFGNVPVGGTHHQPGVGFGTNPQQNVPFGGTHYNQPGAGFGTNPAGGTHYNPPGAGFGTNPVGGTHYNAPGAGFGTNPAGGTHYNQPGFGTNPAGGTHYNQPGFGTNPAGGTHGGFGQPQYNTHGQSATHFGQPGYGGNAFGGAQPHYPVGHQSSYPSQGYHPGGYQGGYAANPGGFGGYNPGGYGGGHGGYAQGGGFPGGYKQNTGPGLGTGLLGGAAAGLPLGLLVGYGLGSMSSSSSSHSPASPSPAAPFQSDNNEAFNEWLKQRTEEKQKEIAANATAASGGDAKISAPGQTPAAVNETAIVDQILKETQMCPGGAGILDASFLNTLVPCNITKVDFDAKNITEQAPEDCKSLTLDIFQVNTDTNENKTVTLRIKQNNATGSNEFVVLTYDIDFVSCVHPLNNPDGKLCETKTFTADPYHGLNETISYLHTTNVSLTQYRTEINGNNSCSRSGACGPDSKPPRNLTSTIINFSILPMYPANIMMSQCVIFKTNTCDPTSTTPCEAPSITTMQTIHTNSSLTKSDFANVNFVLHESADIFLAYTPPPPPPPQTPAAADAAQPGSASTLTGNDNASKSSATTI